MNVSDSSLELIKIRLLLEVKKVKKDPENSFQHNDNTQDEIMNRVNQAFDRIAEEAKNLVNENKEKSKLE